MISPMPFCPSLLPWKNDTPVQVSTSSPRMAGGGGRSPSGAWNSDWFRTTSLHQQQQQRGQHEAEQRAEQQRLQHADRLRSSPRRTWPHRGGAMNWLARPTPMMEPISAWEELFGRPIAQVPRFQMIAAISSAKIIA